MQPAFLSSLQLTLSTAWRVKLGPRSQCPAHLPGPLYGVLAKAAEEEALEPQFANLQNGMITSHAARVGKRDLSRPRLAWGSESSTHTLQVEQLLFGKGLGTGSLETIWVMEREGMVPAVSCGGGKGTCNGIQCPLTCVPSMLCGQKVGQHRAARCGSQHGAVAHLGGAGTNTHPVAMSSGAFPLGWLPAPGPALSRATAPGQREKTHGQQLTSDPGLSPTDNGQGH